MKLRMTIEVDLEQGMRLHDEEERIWAENEILIGNRELIIHSNEIGDYIGEITKVSNIQWLRETDLTECDVCGSEDMIEVPRMGMNCNYCNPI